MRADAEVVDDAGLGPVGFSNGVFVHEDEKAFGRQLDEPGGQVAAVEPPSHAGGLPVEEPLEGQRTVVLTATETVVGEGPVDRLRSMARNRSMVGTVATRDGTTGSYR